MRAYGDVVDAFREYIAHDNNGRGFILVGHSRGSTLLRNLIQNVIEPSDYLRDHMIAAHLPGTNIEVPKDRDVGGTFKNVAACREPAQTGCVIGYSRYRDGDRQLENGPVFGQTDDPDTRDLCVNPATVAAGAKPGTQEPLRARLPFMPPPFSHCLSCREAR